VKNEGELDHALAARTRGEGVDVSPWATAPTLRRELHEGLTERAVPCLETVRACIAQRGSATVREVSRDAGTAAASPPAAERRLRADLSGFAGFADTGQAARSSGAWASTSNADPNRDAQEAGCPPVRSARPVPAMRPPRMRSAVPAGGISRSDGETERPSGDRVCPSRISALGPDRTPRRRTDIDSHATKWAGRI
jgi:hypothetical protein